MTEKIVRPTYWTHNKDEDFGIGVELDGREEYFLPGRRGGFPLNLAGQPNFGPIWDSDLKRPRRPTDKDLLVINASKRPQEGNRRRPANRWAFLPDWHAARTPQQEVVFCLFGGRAQAYDMILADAESQRLMAIYEYDVPEVQDIYVRLRALGYDRVFVRTYHPDGHALRNADRHLF